MKGDRRKERNTQAKREKKEKKKKETWMEVNANKLENQNNIFLS